MVLLFDILFGSIFEGSFSFSSSLLLFFFFVFFSFWREKGQTERKKDIHI